MNFILVVAAAGPVPANGVRGRFRAGSSLLHAAGWPAMIGGGDESFHLLIYMRPTIRVGRHIATQLARTGQCCVMLC